MDHAPSPDRRPFRAFLHLLLAFLLGVWCDRAGWFPGSPRLPHGLGPTFGEAWNVVQKDYVDRQAVQPERMTQGAIEGMLASLGDVGHTTYLTAADWKQMQNSLSGRLEGIGARLSMRQEQPTIVNTVPGSPAQKAGLQGGDILVQVDGKDVAGLSLSRIVEMVRGPPGTEVRLKIKRDDEPKPRDFTITRAEVKVPEVAWQMLPGVPIADIALHEFGEHADEQIKEALEQAKEHGAKGIILDLRSNPGGLKDQAVSVTSQFLSGGTVFIEQNAKGRRTEVPVEPGGIATQIPLVALIDGGTASSAEIMAGALQDYGRAKLVGTHTFGTGTVLKPFKLSDGSAILLAVDEWLTPKGRQIWHHGIKPDIEVALPPSAPILLPENESNLTKAKLEHSKDAQLLKAIEVLKGELAGSVTHR